MTATVSKLKGNSGTSTTRRRKTDPLVWLLALVLAILVALGMVYATYLASGHYHAKQVPVQSPATWTCPNRVGYTAQPGDTWTSIAVHHHGLLLTMPEYRVLSVELNFDPKAGTYDTAVITSLTAGMHVILCYP